MDPVPFTLSQTDREVPFTITIPPNDDIESPEREFTLEVRDVVVVSELFKINPSHLKVIIRDNDTG